MLGGPSVVPLMTYLAQLGYTGLFPGTLRLSWDLWWLLPVDVRSPRGKPYELLLTTYFPNSGVTQELADPAAALLAKCSNWRLAVRVVTYRRVDYFAPYKYLGMDGIFPAFVAKGTGGCYPVPSQNILCLPVYWLCFCHMVTG